MFKEVRGRRKLGSEAEATATAAGAGRHAVPELDGSGIVVKGQRPAVVWKFPRTTESARDKCEWVRELLRCAIEMLESMRPPFEPPTHRQAAELRALVEQAGVHLDQLQEHAVNEAADEGDSGAGA